ncbi:peptidoglycan/LPS O-acetylase OafA/YrhL [Conyzicola lurida]|uniref:Peptidoglycan/LPS O-acetylase OafA/YrhL n=1 Tax=Conyzicola lurida TaxID=1172621 RepID=A0A841APG3_9MICO|nr:acyltransferase family protein [Conyzicola lurida]MBB5843309.1 peptidoglycan/LPS O-acetylase OafA/YrhL [Conyzicola lurida]
MSAGLRPGVEPQRSTPRLDIQGLRAFAVIVVLAYHAGLPMSGGFVGVDVFFVISGFVITAALAREWKATGTIRLGRFALRRYWRLTPALAVMVLVTVLLSGLLQSPLGSEQTTTSATAIGALLLAANAVIAATSGGYFDGPAESNPLLHTWSLSVEEQFYLLFPGLIFTGWMLARKRSRTWVGPLVVVLLIAIPSFLLAMYGPNIASLADNWLSGFYSPLTRAWEFGAGALLALIGPLALFGKRYVAETAGILGAGMLLASLFLITADTPFPGKWTLLPVAGTVLVLIAGNNTRAVVPRLLSMRGPARIGDWSYSLYLWHWPFIVFALTIWPANVWASVIACVLSVIPALCSYRFIEQPLRKLPRISWPRLARRMVVVTAVPLVLALGLSAGSTHGWGSSNVQVLQAANTVTGTVPGCFAQAPGAIRDPLTCVQNPAGTADPVYLLGDSNADMFSPGVKAAAENADAPFTAFTYSACPVVGDQMYQTGSGAPSREGCLQYQTAALTWLDSATPGTVFLGASDYYLRTPEITVTAADGTQTNDETAKIAWYANGLGNVIDRLTRAGHEVVMILPIPNYWLEDFPTTQAEWKGMETCANISLLLGSCNPAMETSLSSKAERQQPTWDAMTATTEEHGATVLDFTDSVCSNGDCALMQDGLAVFRDANHITPQASLSLADQFEAQFRQ